MTNKQRDYVCSILFLLFGIFMFTQSLSIAPMMGKDVGSGFVPKIVAAAIIAVAGVKFILTICTNKGKGRMAAGGRGESSAVEKKAAGAKEDTGPKESTTAKEDICGGLLTIALLVIYVVIFKPLGFLASTVLYLFFQMTILSTEQNRNFILFGIISVAAPVLIYAVFVYVIKMPLPTGIISF